MAGQSIRSVPAYMYLYLCFCLYFFNTCADSVSQIIVNDWALCDISENAFSTLWDLPVGPCFLECNKRKRCKALNFMRGVNKCELLVNDLHDEIDIDKVMCLYVKKEENIATHPVQSQCASCQDGLTCDLPSGNCVYKECEKMDVSNTTLAGNRNSVGSAVQTIPNTGYSLGGQNLRSVCLANGTWDNIPAPYREDYCDPGWHHLQETRSCYLEVLSSKNYDTAKSHCESLGAHLVYIQSVLENALLQQIIAQSVAPTGRWWIGVTLDQNVWVYTGTTDPLTFSNWNPGEPNNDGGTAICVELQTTGWNDGFCYWGRYSMCEKSAIPSKK